MTLDDIPRPIVLFDGECGLCNRWVVWCLARDTHRQLYFTANRSDLAARVLNHFGLKDEASRTIVVFDGERVLLRGDAILLILRTINPRHVSCRLLSLFPRPLRDLGYRIVSRFRFILFGRVAHCALLSEEQRKQIL